MIVRNVLLAAAFGLALYGQQFEVASIKPSGPGDFEHCAGDGPSPGRISWKCITLRELIQQAYVSFASGVVQRFSPPLHVLGGPGWIASDRFDIEATASGNPPLETMGGPMARNLLEDRFQLKVHREMREQPVYSLTVAKSGLKLQPLKQACTPLDPSILMSPPAPGPRPDFCGTVHRPVIKGQDMTMDLHAMSLSDFAGFLSGKLDRNVIDKTAVSGMFDFHLEFLIDDTTRGFPGAQAATPGQASDPGPSIFTAIQQLGLKLESDKGPVEFLVIDHVEKPSAN